VFRVILHDFLYGNIPSAVTDDVILRFVGLLELAYFFFRCMIEQREPVRWRDDLAAE